MVPVVHVGVQRTCDGRPATRRSLHSQPRNRTEVTTLRSARPARLSLRLPTVVDGRVRAAAWASLVAEILIIGTGGAVRLTGSGLGCPT